jgi:hypothetical protein
MTAKDNLIHYMNKLNYTFTKLTSDYNYISSNITKLLNPEIIPFGHLTDLDISMNDLSINIQSILFIIENAIDNDENCTIEQIIKNEEQYEKQKKTDVLVENTMKKMLPIFLLCMMMFDNESILKSKSFGNVDSVDSFGNVDSFDNGIPNLSSVPDIKYDVYIPELD